MSGEFINIFNVPGRICALELNIESLIEFCYEMKRKDAKGVSYTNIGGWQSKNIRGQIFQEFPELENKLIEEVDLFHDELQFKSIRSMHSWGQKVYRQDIDNIWININQKGHLNDWHNHPQSIFSGCFYLTKSKSQIIFEHPFREFSTHYWDQAILEEPNSANSARWHGPPPEPGELMLFPAWLYHKVDVHEEDTDRISLAFNTIMTKRGRG